MIAMMSFLVEYPKGVSKFQLDKDRGNLVKNIPDLLKIRYYDYVTMEVITGKRAILPREFDIIEYDEERKEWFIVKDNMRGKYNV